MFPDGSVFNFFFLIVEKLPTICVIMFIPLMTSMILMSISTSSHKI